jgi:hypothetical protein
MSVAAGESVTLDVDLPAIPQPVAAPAAPPSEAAPVAGSSGQPASSDAGTSSGAPLRIAGLISAGVGVAAGVVGIFVYRAAAAKANAIEQNANPMTPAPYDESNGNYKTLGNAGIGLMVGGGVALATGVALYLVGRSADAESTDAGARVSLWYVPGSGAHVLLGGSF